jgi:hypothetical protein
MQNKVLKKAKSSSIIAPISVPEEVHHQKKVELS